MLNPILQRLRRAYDWTLSLADKPKAERALFALSFAEASFFPIPPDPLLMAMGASRPERALRFALITTVASVSGAALGYTIGAFFMDTLGAWLLDVFDPERHGYEQIKAWYDRYGALAVLIAALTPIPYKVFTIVSGGLAYPLLPFLAVSLFGRGLRFFAEGLLLRFFGRPILAWVDRWFNWVAVGFTVILVGGFVALRYLG